jgi:pimeloyl-ACP methyl ester carboxylesterase
MPFLSVSPSVETSYDIVGEGPPIVLVHGFASSRATNWRAPGGMTLTKAGRQARF